MSALENQILYTRRLDDTTGVRYYTLEYVDDNTVWYRKSGRFICKHNFNTSVVFKIKKEVFSSSYNQKNKISDYSVY